MSNRHRAESGEFTEEVSEQEILKVFDRADAPFLTSREVADELPISRSAVNHRLNQMREKDLVERKETGARSVGWWATRAPAPSAETLRDIEATEDELDRGETVGLAEMKRRLGMDG
ncbi:MAG TPA: helix-turn-helix domain-containing protein [Halococcus sp.]|nr:helix-turn-helix domain-containing protein [Halococcus sp.]